MDTHNSATNATPTPPASFPPLAVGHERHHPARPVVFDPATHGHALVLARWDGGVSTMLHRLALDADTAGADVELFAPTAWDHVGLALQVRPLHTSVSPHGQDHTAGFLMDEITARHEAVDADGVRFPYGSLLVVVDDLEAAQESVHTLVRRVLDEGPAVGVHALVGTHGDPLVGWLGTEDYHRFGFRLVRSAPLSLVRRLVYDGQADGLVPAPSWPGRWVARTPERVVTVTAEY